MTAKLKKNAFQAHSRVSGNGKDNLRELVKSLVDDLAAQKAVIDALVDADGGTTVAIVKAALGTSYE